MSIVLIANLTTGEPGPATGGGVDIQTFLFLGLLVVGIVLAAILFGMTAIRPTWHRLMSNTDRQMLVNAAMIGAVFLLLVVYAAFEPFRLQSAGARQEHEATHRGMLHYTQYCVTCHGLKGEGGPVPPGQVVGNSLFAPPLARPDFRPEVKEEREVKGELIRKTVARGRPGTSMPAWAIEEGGGLNSQEVEDVATFIQHGDWRQVAANVSPEVRAQIAATRPGTAAEGPGGPGRALFVSKGCAGCHAVTGISQSTIGPALNGMATHENIAGILRPVNKDNLINWIKNPPGIKPGTAMPNLGITDAEAGELADFVLSLP